VAAACVAVLLLLVTYAWARSHHVTDQAVLMLLAHGYRERHVDGAGPIVYAGHRDGVIGLCWFRYDAVDLEPMSTYTGNRTLVLTVGTGLREPETAFPNLLAWDVSRTGWGERRSLPRRLGFYYVRGTGAPPLMHWIAVPTWAVLLLLVGLEASLLYEPTLRWRRRKQGRCPSCGYDLRGGSGPCPECGEATHTNQLMATAQP